MSTPRRWHLGEEADALLLLAVGVEGMEEAGRDQLLVSDVIPTAMSCGEADLAVLGFELGDVVDGDPLFRHVTLPHGWQRRPAEDPRSLYLVDAGGRDRAHIFYKAAAYDRYASMALLELGDGER
jgi:hypothetical protein